jgi:hypothetical protein
VYHTEKGEFSMKDDLKAVLVTTSHRGVFFGLLNGYKPGDAVVHLRSARNVLYWPTENKGFIGLATMGPQPGARVGPAADIELRDITSIVVCTDDAVKAFEVHKWSR